MKHVIMGTAGHIDHGKTALVKALTGIDCDTHKEEKARGITINLGFAHLDFDSEHSIGIVDVPGHHDFVHTMVGGASGMDFALLVVGADSGIMPQTREHLQIMDALGVRSGLVALTKIDLVDEDIVLMATEEVRELLKGTFLEESRIVGVSSVTGEGLEELKACIQSVASAVPDRPAGAVFRMFVDRFFTVSGFGTVVTGSVTSGELAVGNTVYLLPGTGKDLRVRRLERHGSEVQQVVAGDRASINVVGMDREDFRRGMIVSDRLLRGTTMVDAKIHLFGGARGLGLWNQALFHLGTFENVARIHLIDKDRMTGGETTLAQIHLGEPCIAQHGDRFVIRSSSGDVTFGGGEIIDAAPLHHRRRPGDLITNLEKIAGGDLRELIVAEVKKKFGAVSCRSLADSMNISVQEVSDVVSRGLSADVLLYPTAEDVYLADERVHQKLWTEVLKNIGAFHRRHPLEETGRTAEELMGTLGIQHGTSEETFLKLVLEKMAEAGELKRVRHSWALRKHSAAVDSEMKSRIDTIERHLKDCGMKTPLLSDLKRIAAAKGITEQELHQILRHLVSGRKAYYVDGNYLHASVVDHGRETLLRTLARHAEGVTVAQFRDLVRGNRKICLLLLAVYDGEGVTDRQGDLRVMTDKGREALAGGHSS